MPYAYRIVSIGDMPDGKIGATIAFWRTTNGRDAGNPPFHIRNFVLDRPTPRPKTRPNKEQQRPNGQWALPWREQQGEWVERGGDWQMETPNPTVELHRAARRVIRRIRENPDLFHYRPRRHRMIEGITTTPELDGEIGDYEDADP